MRRIRKENLVRGWIRAMREKGGPDRECVSLLSIKNDRALVAQR